MINAKCALTHGALLYNKAAVGGGGISAVQGSTVLRSVVVAENTMGSQEAGTSLSLRREGGGIFADGTAAQPTYIQGYVWMRG